MSPDLANTVTKELSARISTNARIAAQSGPAFTATELRKSKRNLKRRKPPMYPTPSTLLTKLST